MSHSRYACTAMVTAALTSLTMFPAARSDKLEQSIRIETEQTGFTTQNIDLDKLRVPIIDDIALEKVRPTFEPESATPDSLSSTSTYYRLRGDVRRCASPLCGGYFVKRVNHAITRCANGRFLGECYVAEINWDGQPGADTGETARLLLRGDLATKRYGGFRNLGVLRVRESWRAANDNAPTGIFYRVKDRGVRCITFPCPTHHEAKLNSTLGRNVAGVDLNGTGAPEDLVARAAAAMTEDDGVLVAGSHVVVTGPAGKADTLKATQFFLQVSGGLSKKPCIKTGCSGQVCAAEPMMTTCEWKPEYACYKKAKCERQNDGSCGFTKTAELTSCLAGK